MAQADGHNETPHLGQVASSFFAVWQHVLLGAAFCTTIGHHTGTWSIHERHAASERFNFS